MAEAFEAEIKIGGTEEAAAKLRAMRDGLDETSESANEAGFSFVEFKAKLDLSLAAVEKITSAASEFADEMERQSGIMAHFTGNVDQAVARTHGLFTELQLVVAQSRTLQTGLRMTGDQFASVAVAANQFAVATGTDNVQALDMLTEALTSGSGEALRRFGISVDGVTGLANVQDAALEQLTARYGNVEARAITAAGQLRVLHNALEDTRDAMIQTVGQSSALMDGFNRLSEAVAGLTGDFGTLNDDVLSDAQALGVGLVATFNAVSNAVINSVGVIVNGLKMVGDVMTMDFTDLADHEDELLRRFNALTDTAENFRRDIAVGVAEAAAATPGQTATAGGSGPSTSSVAPRASTRAPEEPVGPSREEVDAFQELLGLAGDLRTVEQMMADESHRYLDAKLRELEISDKLLLNEKMAAQAVMDKQAEVERFQELQARTTEGVTEATQLMIGAIESSVKGEQKFGKAMKQSFKDWLGNFARKEAMLGASDMAQAIAVTISNPPDSAAKWGGAFAHFAVAAAAGGGAAAIPGGGGGGGGGGGSARPEPSQGGGGGGSGGGTVVININSPVPEDQIGAMYDSAKRAADSRNGSGRGL